VSTSTKSRRKPRCTTCQGRVAQINGKCYRCYNHRLAVERLKQEAIGARANQRALEEREKQRIISLQKAMRPVSRLVKTGKLGEDGLPSYEKKHVGWRCSVCGATCVKQSCPLCEVLR